MNIIPTQCQYLQNQVENLLQLLHQESTLRQQDTTAVRASLNKVISPKFEIVFAGAFSAGKSMLINALLGRELLYSAEGHATGTECYIEYAEPEKERVVLTFLSGAEIQEQVAILRKELGLDSNANIQQPEVIQIIREQCDAIIKNEGGENKSERAKQAKALKLLVDGFEANKECIHSAENAIYSMEQFNFSNLKEAASYARRGMNSAVLKRVEYYCHHPLLEDGNVIIDTPGIDAPVEKDAQITYDKIEHPETSAVVCVLKAAAAGDMTTEETELLEKMRENPGIRDRVFYVFNRIDETWYNSQLRQRLESLIISDFRDTERIYKTSGLLGFYGSLIKEASAGDRFGLDTIFANSVKGLDEEEETPQFVYAFNNYCGTSRKLPSNFPVSIHGFESPNENYVRILGEWGKPLIEQLIKDSGIEEFRDGITRYLKEEKRPQLFANLADDLQNICIQLQKNYLATQQNLASQPQEIEAMKIQELSLLNSQLQEVGEGFNQHISEEVNLLVTNKCDAFEADFNQLQSRMIRRLDELLDTFSVEAAYSRATINHPRNATAPLLAVLVEALYYLANQLEDILVDSTESVVSGFFQRLIDRVRKSEYYRQLYRLLGNDGGIEQHLKEVKKVVTTALISAARIECDRFVRESPRFYDEGTFSIYQFRQTLLQTSQSFDCSSMVEAEPSIRQLLKLDFEPKVSRTIRQTFRQTLNQTLKTHLLPMAEKQGEDIMQQYNQAREYLEKSLETEAAEKIQRNLRLQTEVEEKIGVYNQLVSSINSCLRTMLLNERQLPIIYGFNFGKNGDDLDVVSDENEKLLESEEVSPLDDLRQQMNLNS
ncbi:dynamin-like GTPase family protein [Okeania hirsuta]|uniref:dynamin-like GTPase family protein n=1 Tax=Okeania hirsuta TaxID=1458930 RepID=UPI000F532035|nr:dynamin-like GTPase family protein [Okeania hirsuta]RQH23939.1 dynamin family protein [Okeania hirsuta]